MIKIDDVAEKYKEESEQAGEKHRYAAVILRNLIIAGLSPLLHHVNDILFLGSWSTSREIADVLEIEINQADNLLNRLRELGLAERQPVVNDDGLHYKWRKTPW